MTPEWLTVEKESEQTKSSKIRNLVKVNIDTIKPYSSYGGGKYSISSVKQIITTNKFEALAQNVTKCQNKETIRECSNRKLIKEAHGKCGCLPANIRPFYMNREVSRSSNKSHILTTIS